MTQDGSMMYNRLIIFNTGVAHLLSPQTGERGELVYYLKIKPPTETIYSSQRWLVVGLLGCANIYGQSSLYPRPLGRVPRLAALRSLA